MIKLQRHSHYISKATKTQSKPHHHHRKTSTPRPRLHTSLPATHAKHFSTTSEHSADPATASSNAPKRKVYKFQSIDRPVPYAIAHQWMNDLVELKANKESPYEEDIIFVVQHEPVYTLGKAATLENLRFSVDEDTAFDVQRIGRGGQVTYHGPGQLTVYPILNLKNYKKDLHWYVKQLEDTVINTLQQYNIEGKIDPDNPGVWVDDAKVSALGCKFSRWITMHGFAVNVTPQCHEGFARIIPCGIADRSVTSLQELLDPSLKPNTSAVAHLLDGGAQQRQQQGQQHIPLHNFIAQRSPQDITPVTNNASIETRDMHLVADQLIKSFEQVFDVEVLEHENVTNFYQDSLQQFQAQPREWLKDLDSRH